LTYLLWEDIESICAYPYSHETWENKGEKFFIESRGKQILVLGSLEEILINWAEFRMLHGPHFYNGKPMQIVYTLKGHSDQQNTGDNGLVKD